MPQNTQDKVAQRAELLQTILGQTHFAARTQAQSKSQSPSQGFEIYTGLDYSLKTTVTTNTISARNA